MKPFLRFMMVGIFVACASHAADLVITSFSGNAVVKWDYPTNGIHGYRIEWSGDLGTNKWTDLQQGLRDLTATGSAMSAEVPMFYRIKAMAPPPPNMVYVPSGAFQMGDTLNEGTSDERPVHNVFVSGFYMDRYPVTKTLWDQVANWAVTNGYDITTNSAGGKASNHPAHMVTWYEAVKWCNARSQREDLTPCYYLDFSRTVIYKSGTYVLSNRWVNWNTSGYRLPTEAEWEKAARGGASGYRFPWADHTISHGMANYRATGGESYDLSTGAGYHSAYTNGGMPYTSIGGLSFAANGYGLYDMAGNVWEWSWDWYSGYGSSSVTDPRGPPSGTQRILRGGAWDASAYGSRCAARYAISPDHDGGNVGFRCARGF